jgi:ankyrin repeat protein
VSPALSDVEKDELDRRLIAAAWDNDLARARQLIRAGADVNAEDDTQQSAYLISTSEGYLDLLELTLRHGADVDAKDSFNGTGLIRAADRGHADIVGRLVQAGIEIDHVNNLGWTALHEAIVLGDGSQRYVDTVRVLVAAGADVTLPSQRDNVTPLAHAESRDYDTIATTLRLAIRGDAQDVDRDRANQQLLDAAQAGDADQVALALRDGARLETRDAHRRTPLLLAVTNDRLDVARMLVALGADPDALDDRHDTPWLVTGVTGSVRMLETLLPADPDLTVRNRYGGISVIPASERGHVDYVRRVVRTRIDVNHVNDLGWTAMLEAVILGDGSEPYQQIVRILLDAGADPTITDKDGVTPLQHAEASGQTAVARILRNHPAD